MMLRCMVAVWFICFVVCGVWVGCDVLLFGLSGWLCRFWAGGLRLGAWLVVGWLVDGLGRLLRLLAVFGIGGSVHCWCRCCLCLIVVVCLSYILLWLRCGCGFGVLLVG